MKLKKQFLSAILLSVSLTSLQAFAQSANAKGHAKERVLVKFKRGVSELKIEKKLNAMNSKREKKISGPEIHVIKLPPGMDESLAARKFKEDLDVEFAEVDAIVAPDEFIPNDYFYQSTWGLKKISASYAWDITTGSSGIKIAILDSGIDASHPDLSPNIVPGWNVASNNSDTSPISTHGTRVAGVAAARLNNTIGVSGICGNCKVMPIRVTNDPAGYASFSVLASGITYAANNGARVVNASYAAWTSSSVVSAAQYLKSKGGVFVSSAGNDSATYSNFTDHKDFLVISGTTSSDVLYSWSSRGSVISLAAPGNSYSTDVGGGYGSYSGTSYAAPAVAGVVGLVLSANPNLSSDQVMSILKSSADDLGDPGYDTNFGHGRLNAERAVAMAGAPQPLNGACGTSQGMTFSSAPTSNLCASGSASSVTLLGSDYKWNCLGMNGGSTASCSAKYQAPDTTAPSAPGSLSAKVTTITKGKGKNSSTTVMLSWSASVDNVGVTGYSILRNGVVIGSTSSLSYSDNSVVQGTSYSYSVKAEDAAGNKSLSSSAVTVIP